MITLNKSACKGCKCLADFNGKKNWCVKRNGKLKSFPKQCKFRENEEKKNGTDSA